jgi:flagellar protein FlaG
VEIHRVQPVANNKGQNQQSTEYSGSKKESHSQAAEESVPQAGKLVTEKKVAESVEALNKMSMVTQTHVKFNYHEKMGEYYIQVIDDQRNEVIREIPSKKILDIISSLHETLGLIVDKKI